MKSFTKIKVYSPFPVGCAKRARSITPESIKQHNLDCIIQTIGLFCVVVHVSLIDQTILIEVDRPLYFSDLEIIKSHLCEILLWNTHLELQQATSLQVEVCE